MKSIPVEQLDKQFTQALEHQDEHEAIRLTEGDGTVAWVLRVPESLKYAEGDVVFHGEVAERRVSIVIETKDNSKVVSAGAARSPVFGAGRGTLTIVGAEHRDPFDRLLISQSLVEGMSLVSDDRKLSAYRVPIIW